MTVNAVNMESLCTFLLLEVFKRLDSDDIRCLALTCRRFHEIVNADSRALLLKARIEFRGDLVDAASYGFEDVVARLLHTRAHWDRASEDAFLDAARHGRAEVVRVFLESSAADALVPAALRGDALVEACAYARTDVARVLLDGGADVNARDGDALVFASSCRGAVELVRLLLEHGACVHAQQDAALHWAREVGDADVMRLLQDHRHPA